MDWPCLLCGFGGPHPGCPPVEGSKRGYTHGPWCDGTGRWAPAWRAGGAVRVRNLPKDPARARKPDKPPAPARPKPVIAPDGTRSAPARPKPAAEYPQLTTTLVRRRGPAPKGVVAGEDGRFQCDQCKCVPFHTAKGLETHKSLFHELAPAW
jgi:hypothetical protein